MDSLPPISDPRVLVSTDTVDDAGVYRLSDDLALVFTVDFFTPIVDDPRDFGRIAAANAVSDVYAMGGTPVIAVNVACFPEGDLPPSVLADILMGGREKMDEAGVTVIGGHSVSDPELKYVLAVTGTIDPKRIVTNAGARPDDVLLLTKPIGTGVLTTALKEGALPEEALARVTSTMTALNRSAATAMVEAAASAATDVTGFGLLGHAVGMADASRVTLEIDAEHVPLIDGAYDAISAGFRPAGLLANQHYYGSFVTSRSRADGCTLDLMSDPQTSGGLLIAIGEERVERFASALAGEGGGAYWRIGRAVVRGDQAVELCCRPKL